MLDFGTILCFHVRSIGCYLLPTKIAMVLLPGTFTVVKKACGCWLVVDDLRLDQCCNCWKEHEDYERRSRELLKKHQLLLQEPGAFGFSMGFFGMEQLLIGLGISSESVFIF